MGSSKMIFTGKDDGLTIEKFIESQKRDCPWCWKEKIGYYLKDEAAIWWKSLESEILKLCCADKIEKLFLDKWSHIGKKETKKPKWLFSTGISLLEVDGCIQKEKIIVSINPSCKYNLINVNLAKRLQVSAKHIAKS